MGKLAVVLCALVALTPSCRALSSDDGMTDEYSDESWGNEGISDEVLAGAIFVSLLGAVIIGGFIYFISNVSFFGE